MGKQSVNQGRTRRLEPVWTPADSERLRRDMAAHPAAYGKPEPALWLAAVDGELVRR